MLLFAILVLVGMGNVLVIRSSYSHLQGSATLVNLTGSLRWISQSIQLDTYRLIQGADAERKAIEGKLKRLDETLAVLDTGGMAFGYDVKALPQPLQNSLDIIWKRSINYRQKVDRILSGVLPPQLYKDELNRLYEDGKAILETADVISSALTFNAEQIEGEAMRNLYRLATLDLAILIFGLLMIRHQVILPLRRLVRTSRQFAQGHYGVRVGFRSGDEIGQVALAFDQMADTIQQDMERISNDNVQLKAAEQSLRILSRAVEFSPASVVITDATGRIEYVNPKFVETTGFTFAEALGRTPGMLKSGRTPSAVYRDLWSTIRSGREWRGELLNRRKNGELFWENTRISPLKAEDGTITHFIAVKEDVNERKATEERIRSLNAELEQRVQERTQRLSATNKELEAFSYSISHDLRAPLRGINGFAHLMQENCKGCSNLESREHLQRIRQASVRMGDLIDDLLELSRVSRHALKVQRVPISELVQSILGELASAEPERSVTIEVQRGLTVRGDPVLLRAALQNLLGNAWKFTSRQALPRIAFGCPDSPGENIFYVADNGAGFDMKYAGKLFSAFQRLHRPEEFEGTGIGLATVQRIINLHGGRIWAESRPGEGATFYFALPENLPEVPPS